MKTRLSDKCMKRYLSALAPKKRSIQGQVMNSMLIEWISAASIVGQTYFGISKSLLVCAWNA